MIAAGLLLAGLTHAASFDCEKAQKKVEKMVCADASLSALDSDMAAIYTDALKKVANPLALKARQRQWLKALSVCKTTSCLKGAYFVRIRALRNGKGAKVYDDQQESARREADKAVRLQKALVQYPMQTNEITKPDKLPFCAHFLDLLEQASPEVVYIEPVLRTNDPTHPGLGEYLACDLPEKEEKGLGTDIFFVDLLGSRQFRLYRLDLGKNQGNRWVEYLYGQESVLGFEKPTAQYVRVKVSPHYCAFDDGVPVSAEGPLNPELNIYEDYFSAWVRHKNKYYIYRAAIIGGGYFELSLYAYDTNKRQFPNAAACYWSAKQLNLKEEQP